MRRAVPLLFACAVALALSACPPPAADPKTGGPVDGDPDTHCQGLTPVLTDPGVCGGVGEGEGEGEGAAEGEGEGEGGDDDFGETMFNAEGDDDDCKYHVSFTASAITENTPTTFTVTATDLAGDKGPTTGANTRAEVFLDETHSISGGTTTEGPDGTYTITPVTFDKPGRWTVRFHFFENCVDSDTSPHGHAAFFLDVP
ncbi:MAG TPA: hypothetical protein VGO62_18650 [Myxococcota bacterium]